MIHLSSAEGWSGLPPRPTPFAVVHGPRLLRNIERVCRIAQDADLEVRPHVKTHKTLEIANLQCAAGAGGITASKPTEAMMFVEAGFASVLVAYPVVSADRAAPLLACAASTGAELIFSVDSTAGVTALSKAAATAQLGLRIYIEIDVGLNRCGVAADSQALLDLAEQITRSPSLRLIGLMAHAGHGYAARTRDRIASIAEEERRQMLLAKERVERRFGGALRLSVGSTPTVLACPDFTGIHEIRPGNYVFMDLTAVRLGLAGEEEIALGVVTTIVSANEGYYVVDAGSKALSSDRGPHGVDGLSGFGIALHADRDDDGIRLPVERLSEEHGLVARRGTELALGERLVILPNHSCSVVNLHESLSVLGEENEVQWQVMARGAIS